MNRASVTGLDERKRRSRRITRAIAAHERLRDVVLGYAPHDRTGGRAWINGREVGGVDPLYRHLTESYD